MDGVTLRRFKNSCEPIGEFCSVVNEGKATTRFGSLVARARIV